MDALNPPESNFWGCFVALFLQAHDKLQLMRSRICGWDPFQTCLSDMGRSWISELVESWWKVDVCKNVQQIGKRMEGLFHQLKPRGQIGKDRSWEPELRLRTSFAFDCRLQTPWFECQIQMLSTLRSKCQGLADLQWLACKQNYHACTQLACSSLWFVLICDVFSSYFCWNCSLAWGYQQGDYFKPHTDGSWNGSRITSKGKHRHCYSLLTLPWRKSEEKSLLVACNSGVLGLLLFSLHVQYWFSDLLMSQAFKATPMVTDIASSHFSSCLQMLDNRRFCEQFPSVLQFLFNLHS